MNGPFAQPRWAKPFIRYGFDGIGSFPLFLLLAADGAATAWNEVCGVSLTLEDEGHCDVLFRWACLNHGLVAVSDMPGPDHARRLYVSVTPDVRWSELDAQAVLGHEFGHALGLSHGPPGSLMYAEYDPKVRVPQAWDVAEAVARYGVPS